VPPDPNRFVRTKEGKKNGNSARGVFLAEGGGRARGPAISFHGFRKKERRKTFANLFSLFADKDLVERTSSVGLEAGARGGGEGGKREKKKRP